MTRLHKVVWMPGTLDDVRAYPEKVRETVGYALFVAQRGGKHRSATPLRGSRGASVVEIAVRDADVAYRVVYALGVPGNGTICVLHAFIKKSHRGPEVPREVEELIRKRLIAAEQMTEEDFRGERP